MKWSSDISSFRKTLFFALGLLVAAFVVSQEVIEHHCAKLVEVSEQTEDTGEDSSEEQVYAYSFNVLLPAGQIELAPFSPIFIREVIVECEVPQYVPVQVPLYDTPHYKTLFRQFISPNAP